MFFYIILSGSKLASSQPSSQTPTKINTINNVISTPREGKQTDVHCSEDMMDSSEGSSGKEGLLSKVTDKDINTKLLVDDDSEMSEVIEKGTSQNVIVDVKENAQHWHSGQVGQSDTGLQVDTETELMDTENTDVTNNSSNSRELSEVVQNGECLQGLSRQDSVESLAMSEIIEPVQNEKIVLKEKGSNITGVVTDSRKITNDKTDGKSSNDKVNIAGRADKENSVADKVDMTGDHCNTEVDHFDDDLTEEQLMETLEN